MIRYSNRYRIRFDAVSLSVTVRCYDDDAIWCLMVGMAMGYGAVSRRVRLASETVKYVQAVAADLQCWHSIYTEVGAAWEAQLSRLRVGLKWSGRRPYEPNRASWRDVQRSLRRPAQTRWGADLDNPNPTIFVHNRF